MKILILSEANSIHTRRWVKSLSSKGVAIHLFSLSKPTDNFYEHLNIKVYYTDIKKNIIRGNFFLKLVYLFAVPKITSLIRKNRYDITHAHYLSSYGLLSLFIRGNKTKKILSVWGSDILIFPRKNIFTKLITKKILLHHKHILSTSKVMQNEVLKYVKKEIFITPFGIDLKLFDYTKFINLNKLNNQNYNIGIAKSIESIYGFEILLDALYFLKEKGIKFTLNIAGTGSLKDKLIKEAERLKIDENINFLGFVEHKKMPDFISKQDMLVYPSLSESFGVSALEAMAMKKPVIASNLQGLAEIIESGKTGLLFKSGDSKMLADSMLILISDEKYRNSISNNAYIKVSQEFRWELCVEKMLTIYKKII